MVVDSDVDVGIVDIDDSDVYDVVDGGVDVDVIVEAI